MTDNIFKNYILLFLLSFVFQANLQAQCSPNNAGFLSGTTTTILAGDTTTAPIYTTAPTGLTDTEFIFVQKNQLADDGFGPAVLTADSLGMLSPSQFGLVAMDTLGVISFSYELTQVRTIVDSIFGAFYSPGMSCCAAAQQLFPGLCDTLNAYGIFSGADVNNLNDVIVFVGIFAGTNNGTISIQNLDQSLQLLNSYLGFFGGCSGGVLEVCYAVEPDSASAMDCYAITSPVSVQRLDLNEVALQALPNPFDDNLQIRFYAAAGDYTLQIVDARGQVVQNKTHYLTAGNQNLTINTKDLPTGYYFIRLIGDKVQGVQKIIKK